MIRPLLLLPLLALPCLAQDGAPPPTAAKLDARRYRVHYESSMEMDLSRVGQGQVAITANTEIDYSIRPPGRTFSVVLDRMHVRTVIGGAENLNMTMGADGLHIIEGGQTNDIPYDDANPTTQEMLRDSYREPLATIEVDDAGKELSRKTSTRPGAKDTLFNGGVENTRFFHAPYPAEGATWEAEREMPMGNGNIARGTLTYTRGAARPDGKVPVAVKGTLTGGGQQGPLEIKEATYVIDGQQVWDPTLGDWAEAKVELTVSMTLVQGENLVATSTGKIVASLGRREAQDKE